MWRGVVTSLFLSLLAFVALVWSQPAPPVSGGPGPRVRLLTEAPTPELTGVRLGDILLYSDEQGGRRACIVTSIAPGNTQVDCGGEGSGAPGPQGPPGPPGEPGNPGTGFGGLLEIEDCGSPTPTFVLRSKTDPSVRVIPCFRPDLGGFMNQTYPDETIPLLERPLVLTSSERTVGSTFTLDPTDFANEASGEKVRPRLLLTCNTAADCTGTLDGASNTPVGTEVELYNHGIEGNDILLPDVANVYDGPGTTTTIAAGERVILVRRPGLWTGHGTGTGTGLIDTNDLADESVTAAKLSTGLIGPGADGTLAVYGDLLNVIPQTITAATQTVNCGTWGPALALVTLDAAYTLSSAPQISGGGQNHVCTVLVVSATHMLTLVDGNGVETVGNVNLAHSPQIAEHYYWDTDVWRHLATPLSGCTVTFAGGMRTVTCGTSGTTLQGTFTVAETDGTACLTIDPTTGAVTQGAACQTVTYSHAVAVATEVYDATTWDGDLTVPTKDAIRDKIETLPMVDVVDGYSFRCIEGDGISYLRTEGAVNCSGTETFDQETFQPALRSGTLKYLTCARDGATGVGNTRTYTLRLDGTTNSDAVCTMANASTCIVSTGTTAVTAGQIISVIAQETAGTPAEQEVVCSVGVAVTS